VTGTQSLGRFVVLRIGVCRCDVDGPVVQVGVVRRKRVVWGYGEGEAEGIFAIEVKPEQPLLSDETERLVEGQCCRIIEFGFKYNLDYGS
jgi:hypothetical protein